MCAMLTLVLISLDLRSNFDSIIEHGGEQAERDYRWDEREYDDAANRA